MALRYLFCNIGAFTSGNYGPPSGYCFDTSCHYCRDDPIVDSEVFHAHFDLYSDLLKPRRLMLVCMT